MRGRPKWTVFAGAAVVLCGAMTSEAEYLADGFAVDTRSVLAVELCSSGAVRDEVLEKLLDGVVEARAEAELQRTVLCVERLVATRLASAETVARLAARLDARREAWRELESPLSGLRRALSVDRVSSECLRPAAREALRGAAVSLRLENGEKLDLDTAEAAVLAVDRGWTGLMPFVEEWYRRDGERLGWNLEQNFLSFWRRRAGGGDVELVVAKVFTGELGEWALVEAIAGMVRAGTEGLPSACKRTLDTADGNRPESFVVDGRLEMKGVFLSRFTRLELWVLVRVRRGFPLPRMSW